MPFNSLSGNDLLNAQYWLAQAALLAPTLTSTELANFVLYTPTSCISCMPNPAASSS